MEPYNPNKVYYYTIDDLVYYVISKEVTIEDLYKVWKFKKDHPKFEHALSARDNEDWEEALKANTESAYQSYLEVYDNESPFYYGMHVAEAKDALKQFESSEEERPKEEETQDDNAIESEGVQCSEEEMYFNDNESEENKEGDGEDAEEDSEIPSEETDGDVAEESVLIDETRDIADNSDKSEDAQSIEDQRKDDNSDDGTKSSFVENAKLALSKLNLQRKKLLKPIVCVAGVCVLFFTGYWAFEAIKKSTEPVPLTYAEVDEIVKEVNDSLKVDLFDGFYTLPASLNQGFCVTDEGTTYNPTSREGVIYSYVAGLSTKRLNVYNKNGEWIHLPNADAGLDSICLTQPPFIEYIDNNGLRRVVALFHDELYYYLGDCGNHDGFRQYILANGKGKSGLVDVNGTVLKDFFNDRIIPSSSGYYVKNGSTQQYYNFAGSTVDMTNTKTATSNSYWDSYNPVRCSRSDDYFKDKSSGRIFATFSEISYYYDKSRYKVKGKNGKWGVYDAASRKMILPTIYDEVNVYCSKTNIYPIKQDEKWGFVKDGREIITPKFKDVGYFSDNPVRAAAKDEDGKWGYIDINGEFKIKPKYYSAAVMSPNGARVMNGPNQYGYIDASGNFIAGWYHEMGSEYRLNRIWVKNKDGLKGFVDGNNKLVIPYLFEGKDAPYFEEPSKLAKVTYKGVNWYINTNGAFCYPADTNLLPNNQDIQLQIQEAEMKAQEKAETENKKTRRMIESALPKSQRSNAI